MVYGELQKRKVVKLSTSKRQTLALTTLGEVYLWGGVNKNVPRRVYITRDSYKSLKQSVSSFCSRVGNLAHQKSADSHILFNCEKFSPSSSPYRRNLHASISNSNSLVTAVDICCGGDHNTIVGSCGRCYTWKSNDVNCVSMSIGPKCPLDKFVSCSAVRLQSKTINNVLFKKDFEQWQKYVKVKKKLTCHVFSSLNLLWTTSTTE